MKEFIIYNVPGELLGYLREMAEKGHEDVKRFLEFKDALDMEYWETFPTLNDYLKTNKIANASAQGIARQP